MPAISGKADLIKKSVLLAHATPHYTGQVQRRSTSFLIRSAKLILSLPQAALQELLQRSRY